MLRKIILRVVAVFAILIALLFGYLQYLNHFSEEAIIGKTNVQNAKKVTLGMDSDELISVMGEPNMVRKDENGNPIYLYSTNDNSFAYIAFHLNSDLEVALIFRPENPES